jgi:YwqJ-like deaminase
VRVPCFLGELCAALGVPPPDPIGFHAGDPVNNVDPTGLDEISTGWISSDVSWITEDNRTSILGPLGIQPNNRAYVIGTSDGDYVNISDSFGGGRVLYEDLVNLANGMTTASSSRMRLGRDVWKQDIQQAIAGLGGASASNGASSFGVVALARGIYGQGKDTVVGIGSALRHPIQTGQAAVDFITRPYDQVERDLANSINPAIDRLVDTDEGRGRILFEMAGAVVPYDEIRHIRHANRGIPNTHTRVLSNAAEQALLRTVAEDLANYLGRVQKKKPRGPVLTVVRDRVTGELFDAQNLHSLPSQIHPLLDTRLKSYLRSHGNNLSPVLGVPGLHADFVALNNALLRREALGLPITSLDDFSMYNVSLWKNRLGTTVPRCVNCVYLTSGVRVLSGN